MIDYSKLANFFNIIVNELSQYNPTVTEMLEGFVPSDCESYDFYCIQALLINEILSVLSNQELINKEDNVLVNFSYVIKSKDDKKDFFEKFFLVLKQFSDINKSYLENSNVFNNNEKISLLLKMFYSYSNSKVCFYKKFGLRIIHTLHNLSYIDENNFERILEFIAITEFNKLIDYNLHNLKYMKNIPTFVFYYIDYVIWKTYAKNDLTILDKYYLPKEFDSWKSFNFEKNNDITFEHFFPQSRKCYLNSRLGEDIDSIGNLALISRSFNSSLLDKSPSEKAIKILNKKCNSLKLCVMSKICLNKKSANITKDNTKQDLFSLPQDFYNYKNDWNLEDMKKHRDGLILLIENEIKDFENFKELNL